ncbi:hypothetical protein BDZ89DRAFT_1047839 [Hymenopellis radicata]|nr:hypothetical protein BDZ89DRAFT_1047839 [Hymenopellis radicata]
MAVGALLLGSRLLTAPVQDHWMVTPMFIYVSRHRRRQMLAQSVVMVELLLSRGLRHGGLPFLASLGQPAKKTSTVHSSHEYGRASATSICCPASCFSPTSTGPTTVAYGEDHGEPFQHQESYASPSASPRRALTTLGTTQKSIIKKRFPSAIGNLVKACAGDALTTCLTVDYELAARVNKSVKGGKPRRLPDSDSPNVPEDSRRQKASPIRNTLRGRCLKHRRSLEDSKETFFREGGDGDRDSDLKRLTRKLTVSWFIVRSSRSPACTDVLLWFGIVLILVAR